MNCIICKEVLEDYGNNPDPVRHKGRCCNKCNNEIVIPVRLTQVINIPLRESIRIMKKTNTHLKGRGGGTVKLEDNDGM